MLKKLAAKLNPFAVKRVAASKDEPERTDAHPHSFSCACKPCVDHTNALTKARLKSQGA
jgi:hypothetical protein